MMQSLLFPPNLAITRTASFWALIFCLLPVLPHAQSADLIVDSLADSIGQDGVCTLREAITAANRNEDFLDCVGVGVYGDDRITIVVSGTITISLAGPRENDNQTGDFDIKGSLTIVGLGSGTSEPFTEVSGDDLDRVFDIHTGDFSVEDLRVKSGNTTNAAEGDIEGSGGGILFRPAHSTLTITDCTMEDNYAINRGGGISLNGTFPELLVYRSVIRANTATRERGGAISNQGYEPTIEIWDSFIEQNYGYDGGGLYTNAFNHQIKIHGTAFDRNRALHDGGGIGLAEWGLGTFEITDSTFSDNSASRWGGIAFILSQGPGDPMMPASVRVENTSFTGNRTASESGGAIIFRHSQHYLPKIASVAFIDCHFEKNAARFGGGAIANLISVDSTFSFSDCAFLENVSEISSGGALLNSGPNTRFTLSGGQFVGNSAGGYGGAIHSGADHSWLALSDLTFLNNHTEREDGGAISLAGSINSDTRLAMENCTVRDCTSAGCGGGVSIAAGLAITEIRSCTFDSNEALEAGGGFHLRNQPESILIEESAFVGNISGQGGGGIAIELDSESQSNGPVFARCAIEGNVAQIYGGGFFSGNTSEVRLANCGLFENQAAAGGGISSLGSQPWLSNCTLSGNTGNSAGGGIHATPGSSFRCENSILWENGVEIEEVPSGSANVVRYSCVQGGWPGEGNLEENPGFLDPLAGDYRLTAGSPCIDRGDPDSQFNDGDRPPGQGEPRNDLGMFGGPYNLIWQPIPADEHPISILDSMIFENISHGSGGGVYVSGPEVSPLPTNTPTISPSPTATAEPTSTPTITPTRTACDSGYYLLDSFGGRHRVGNPYIITGPVYFGEPIARDMERAVCDPAGSATPDLVVLDGFGGAHFVTGTDCDIEQDFYFGDASKNDFPEGRAVDLEMSADSLGFWVLTDYGGIYRAGSTKGTGGPAAGPQHRPLRGSWLRCSLRRDARPAAGRHAGGLASRRVVGRHRLRWRQPGRRVHRP